MLTNSINTVYRPNLNKFTHHQALMRTLLVIFCLFMQACTLLPNKHDWPTNIPPMQQFVVECKKNSASCETSDSTKQFLMWVKRFYLGSIFYPTGWIEMTDLLTATLPNDAKKQEIRQNLDKLGLKIVQEWAKKNDERLITSQNIAIWGGALRTSALKNEQANYIRLVEQDVELMLAKQLSSEEINSERYYPVEDYDNF